MSLRNRYINGSALSSVAMQQGQRSFIKSIQRGTVTITSGNTTATAAITAVVTANTRLKWLGCNDAGADTLEKGLTRLDLTNSTTITATVGAAPTNNLVTGYEVIEYFPGVLKSVQRGTITIVAGNTSNTATITTVNTAKTEVTFMGALVLVNSIKDYIWLTLTNSTTITATNNINALGNATVSYEAAEFF